MEVVAFYTAARRAGLLTPLTAGAIRTHCVFRAMDAAVLEGLALSREVEIDYPAAWLTLLPGDAIAVAGKAYQVREVRVIGDGSEVRAWLSPSH